MSLIKKLIQERDEEEQALYAALMDYYDKNEELFIQLTTTPEELKDEES